MGFFEKFLGGNNERNVSASEKVVPDSGEGEVDRDKQIERIKTRISELRSKAEFGPDDKEEVEKLDRNLSVLEGE